MRTEVPVSTELFKVLQRKEIVLALEAERVTVNYFRHVGHFAWSLRTLRRSEAVT